MSPAFDLVAIGDALVDVIAPCEPAFLAQAGLQPDGWTRINEDRALDLHARMAPGVVVPGGSGANTACGVATLGGRAGFVGKVADDPLGEVFHQALSEAGVAFGTLKLAGGSTGRSLINVTPDGLRSMATCLGAAETLSVGDLDQDWLMHVRVLKLEAYLFQTEAGRALALRAAEIARASGASVALSLSSASVVRGRREMLTAFVDSQTDVVIGDVEEAQALWGEIRPLAGKTLAVTRGARGSWIAAEGQTTELPAAPVERVVDTTGAGDQYAAGFLFGLARGLPPARAGELGARCAAEVIVQPGPRPQRPLLGLSRAFGIGLGDEE